MELLKLVALDTDDLEIVSAHLQDAVVCVGDVRWRPAEKRLVIGLARFDWEGAQTGQPDYQRRSAALRFERVNSFKCRGIKCNDKTAMLSLLAVSYDETDGPAGVITLTFSGDAALRLEVECVECELADLGPIWTTTCCPAHDDARSDDAGAPSLTPGLSGHA
jgi:Protein of unknown function (DUF2948)